MVNLDDFWSKNTYFYGQYGCVSVECSKVTVLAVAQVYRLGSARQGLLKTFQILQLNLLTKNLRKRNQKHLVNCIWFSSVKFAV